MALSYNQLLVVKIFLTLPVAGEYNGLATDMEALAAGIDGGMDFLEGIAGVFKEGSKIGRVLGKIAPFLGTFSAIADIVGFYGDSPEEVLLNQVIDMLNEGFKNVNERFDRLDVNFDQLKAVMEKESFWIRLNDMILDLNSVQARVDDYFDGLRPGDRKAALDRYKY